MATPKKNGSGRARRSGARSTRKSNAASASVRVDSRRAAAQLARLAQALPEPRCELDHKGAWQLLVATILSAQSTDARVNRVTPALFQRYPTPAALAAAEQSDVEALVHATGFFRNKAKSIIAASKLIADRHEGKVPRSLDAVLELPGVARKTANLVLGTAYGLATGIVVDTHAGRVARRLGLSAEEDPNKVERDLCALVPQTEWIDTGHRLVLHGRYLCKAKQPECAACPIAELCPSAQAPATGSVNARASAERARVAVREGAHS